MSGPRGLVGDKILVSVRPENIDVLRDPGSADNVFAATVEASAFLGEFMDCRMDVGGTELRVRVHPSLAPGRGESVFVRFPPESCMVVAQ